MVQPVASSILDIAPYKPGDSKTGASVKKVTKLSSNENPFGPSPKAVKAMAEAAKKAHRYPDGGATVLCNILAARYDIPAEQIVCGAGSDELISLLCFAFSGVGDEVLYTEHGFLMYPISAMAAGATPVKAAETNLRADVDNLLAAVTERTKIVFIANPNNPTGSYISKSELTRLHAGLPKEVLLVVDGAYAEYVEEADYSCGLELALSESNVVMTRTFSKIYGLGGLRIGWAVASPDVAGILHRVRGPFNVSSVAQAAATASLEDAEYEAQSRTHNNSWLVRYKALLADLPVTFHPSVTNFILLEFPTKAGNTAKEADIFLREQGIIARNVSSYGLPDCLRVSIGTDAENEAVVAALHQFFGV